MVHQKTGCERNCVQRVLDVGWSRGRDHPHTQRLRSCWRSEVVRVFEQHESQGFRQRLESQAAGCQGHDL